MAEAGKINKSISNLELRTADLNAQMVSYFESQPQVVYTDVLNSNITKTNVLNANFSNINALNSPEVNINLLRGQNIGTQIISNFKDSSFEDQIIWDSQVTESNVINSKFDLLHVDNLVVNYLTNSKLTNCIAKNSLSVDNANNVGEITVTNTFTANTLNSNLSTINKLNTSYAVISDVNVNNWSNYSDNISVTVNELNLNNFQTINLNVKNADLLTITATDFAAHKDLTINTYFSNSVTTDTVVTQHANINNLIVDDLNSNKTTFTYVNSNSATVNNSTVFYFNAINTSVNSYNNQSLGQDFEDHLNNYDFGLTLNNIKAKNLNGLENINIYGLLTGEDRILNGTLFVNNVNTGSRTQVDFDTVDSLITRNLRDVNSVNLNNLDSQFANFTWSEIGLNSATAEFDGNLMASVIKTKYLNVDDGVFHLNNTNSENLNVDSLSYYSLTPVDLRNANLKEYEIIGNVVYNSYSINNLNANYLNVKNTNIINLNTTNLGTFNSTNVIVTTATPVDFTSLSSTHGVIDELTTKNLSIRDLITDKIEYGYVYVNNNNFDYRIPAYELTDFNKYNHLSTGAFVYDVYNSFDLNTAVNDSKEKSGYDEWHNKNALSPYYDVMNNVNNVAGINLKGVANSGYTFVQMDEGQPWSLSNNPDLQYFDVAYNMNVMNNATEINRTDVTNGANLIWYRTGENAELQGRNYPSNMNVAVLQIPTFTLQSNSDRGIFNNCSNLIAAYNYISLDSSNIPYLFAGCTNFNMPVKIYSDTANWMINIINGTQVPSINCTFDLISDKMIGYSAGHICRNAQNLTDVDLYFRNYPATTVAYAFVECVNLRNVNIDGQIQVCNQLFELNCHNLQRVNIDWSSTTSLRYSLQRSASAISNNIYLNSLDFSSGNMHNFTVAFLNVRFNPEGDVDPILNVKNCVTNSGDTQRFFVNCFGLNSFTITDDNAPVNCSRTMMNYGGSKANNDYLPYFILKNCNFDLINNVKPLHFSFVNNTLVDTLIVKDSDVQSTSEIVGGLNKYYYPIQWFNQTLANTQNIIFDNYGNPSNIDKNMFGADNMSSIKGFTVKNYSNVVNIDISTYNTLQTLIIDNVTKDGYNASNILISNSTNLKSVGLYNLQGFESFRQLQWDYTNGEVVDNLTLDNTSVKYLSDVLAPTTMQPLSGDNQPPNNYLQLTIANDKDFITWSDNNLYYQNRVEKLDLNISNLVFNFSGSYGDGRDQIGQYVFLSAGDKNINIKDCVAKYGFAPIDPSTLPAVTQNGAYLPRFPYGFNYNINIDNVSAYQSQYGYVSGALMFATYQHTDMRLWLNNIKINATNMFAGVVTSEIPHQWPAEGEFNIHIGSNVEGIFSGMFSLWNNAENYRNDVSSRKLDLWFDFVDNEPLLFSINNMIDGIWYSINVHYDYTWLKSSSLNWDLNKHSNCKIVGPNNFVDVIIENRPALNTLKVITPASLRGVESPFVVDNTFNVLEEINMTTTSNIFTLKMDGAGVNGEIPFVQYDSSDLRNVSIKNEIISPLIINQFGIEYPTARFQWDTANNQQINNIVLEDCTLTTNNFNDLYSVVTKDTLYSLNLRIVNQPDLLLNSQIGVCNNLVSADMYFDNSCSNISYLITAMKNTTPYYFNLNSFYYRKAGASLNHVFPNVARISHCNNITLEDLNVVNNFMHNAYSSPERLYLNIFNTNEVHNFAGTSYWRGIDAYIDADDASYLFYNAFTNDITRFNVSVSNRVKNLDYAFASNQTPYAMRNRYLNLTIECNGQTNGPSMNNAFKCQPFQKWNKITIYLNNFNDWNFQQYNNWYWKELTNDQHTGANWTYPANPDLEIIEQ